MIPPPGLQSFFISLGMPGSKIRRISVRCHCVFAALLNFGGQEECLSLSLSVRCVCLCLCCWCVCVSVCGSCVRLGVLACAFAYLCLSCAECCARNQCLHDSLPEWSKGVDSSSTSASCVGSNPTAVILQPAQSAEVHSSQETNQANKAN